jgi:hypothetical protein
MRSKLSLLAASAALTLAAQAAVDLGNGVQVVPNVIGSVEANDNLFLAADDTVDETIWRLSPGIRFVMGEGALNSAQFSYNEEFQFYSDNSDLDTSLSLVDFSTNYDDGKMKIAIDAWFHEANQATRDTPTIAGLVKRTLIHGGISDEVQFSEKSAGKIGLVYDDTDYSRAGYTDWQWVEVPVQYFYEVQPKLDASVGFRYRQNNLDGPLGGFDSDELFYNVGVRGEITPKLTGEVQVGYLQFNPDAGNDEDSFGLKANLTFAVSPKTNLLLDANSQYGYSGIGQSYQDTGLTFSFNTAISAAFSVNGNVFWHAYDYTTTTQQDDYYGGQIAGTYAFNEHAELSASYAYADNDSNLAFANFKQNRFVLSATLKY